MPDPSAVFRIDPSSLLFRPRIETPVAPAIDPLVREAVQMLNGNNPAAIGIARKAFESAIATYAPSDPQVRFTLDLLEQIGTRFSKIEQVRECYQRLAALFRSGDAEATLALMQVHRRLGDFEARSGFLHSAKHAFELALRLSDSIAQVPELLLLDLRLNLALVCARSGQLEAAHAYGRSAFSMVDVISQEQGPSGADVCRLLLSYGEACLEYGQFISAERAFGFVVGFHGHVDPALSGELKARGSLGQALLSYQQGRGPFALVSLCQAQRSLALVPIDSPYREQIEIEVARQKAFTLIGIGRREEAGATVDDFLAKVDAAKNILPSARITFLLSALDASLELVRVDAAQSLLRRVESLLEGGQNPVLAPLVNARAASVAFYQGNLHGALGFLDQALSDGVIGQLPKELRALLYLRQAELHLLLGNDQLALGASKTALSVLEVTSPGKNPPPSNILALANSQRALIATKCGESEAAEMFSSRAERALPLVSVVGEVAVRAAYFLTQGKYLQCEEALIQARARVETACALLTQHGLEGHPRMQTVCASLAGLCARVGDLDRARSYAARAGALSQKYPGVPSSLMF